jgi:DNA-binding NarL/FixJ family response regulator
MSTAPAHEISVWLIEDNSSFRRNLAAAVDATDGLSCTGSFHRCEGAIAELAAGPKPDVVLLDIGLPGMGGLEGIGHLLTLAPEVKVIILTVFEDDDKIFKAICTGAAGYLLKTASLEEIARAIDEVVAGGAPMNPRIAKRVLGFFSSLHVEPRDYRLTPREKEILQLLVEGLIKKEIADRLDLSFHTVDMYFRKIYQKLQVHNATGAVAKAVRERLV